MTKRRYALALALAGAIGYPAVAQPPPYPGAGQPTPGYSQPGQPGQPQGFPGGGQPQGFPGGGQPAAPGNPTPASMVGTIVGMSPEAGTISVEQFSPQSQVQGQQPWQKPKGKPMCMTFRVDQSQIGGAPPDQGSPWAKKKGPPKGDWGKWGKNAWAKGSSPEQLQVGQVVEVFYEGGYGKPTWGKMKPEQAPPTQSPPTQAPPTQAPPTQAPPTQGPPEAAPSQGPPQQAPPDQGPPPMKKDKGRPGPGQDQPGQADTPPAPQPTPAPPQVASDQPQGPPAPGGEQPGPSGPPAGEQPGAVTAGYPPAEGGAPPAEGKAIGPPGTGSPAMPGMSQPIARAITIRILPRAAGAGAPPERAPPPPPVRAPEPPRSGPTGQ